MEKGKHGEVNDILTRPQRASKSFAMVERSQYKIVSANEEIQM